MASILTFLLASLIVVSFANQPTPNGVQVQTRTVTIAKIFNPYGVGSFLDTNNTIMLSTGIFTKTQADAMMSEGLAAFYNSTGIDMSSSNPDVVCSSVTGICRWDALGIETLPTAFGLLPNKTWFVSQDSAHPHRVNKWQQLEFNIFAIFSKPVTFSSGLMAGATAQPGMFYFYGYVVFAEIGGDLTKKNNREVVKNYCTKLGNTYINQWGKQEFLNTYFFVDQNGGNQGYVVSGTAEDQFNINGQLTPVYNAQTVFSWPGSIWGGDYVVYPYNYSCPNCF